MDVPLYGVGMFTPSILAALSLVGRGSFLSMDIASSEGTALLDLFLLAGFALNIWLVERWGRIRLQALGFMGMAIGLLLLSLSALQSGEHMRLALVLCGFAIFNLMVNAGPNPTTYLLPAELFPTELRASGHGLAAAAGKLGAVVGIFSSAPRGASSFCPCSRPGSPSQPRSPFPPKPPSSAPSRPRHPH